MPYTHVQCIGYQVPAVAKVGTTWDTATWTIPSDDANGDEIDPVIVNGNPAYQMDNQDPAVADLRGSRDAYNRVVRFLNVLTTAKQHQNIEPASTTLKVFMAPEFYFRPEVAQGGYNAYSYDIYQAIKDVLRQKIEEPDFKDWLIVPGTIMWKVPMGQASGKRGPLTADTYFNSCVYIYHDTNVARTSHVLQKAKASHIDGVPLGVSPSPTSAPQILPQYNEQVKRKKHVLRIGGLMIGLEICLEHRAYRNGEYGLLRQVKRPDFFHLQLLTAGGMEIHEKSVTLRGDGVFFRNDGLLGDLPPDQPPFVECKYKTIPPPPPHPPPNSTLTDLPAPTIVAIAQGNAELYLKPPVPARGDSLFEELPFNKQQIMIYPQHQI